MLARVLVGTVAWILCASGGERMVISICNFTGVPGDVLARAQADATFVFAFSDVEITWTTCVREEVPDEQCSIPRFTIRLRSTPSAPVSMGRAFVDGTNAGVMADVYYSFIGRCARWNGVVSTPDLMGFVIAHEIGHLLLGAHHLPGIMSEHWGSADVKKMEWRMLFFGKAESTAIRRSLKMRSAALAEHCRVQQVSPNRE